MMNTSPENTASLHVNRHSRFGHQLMPVRSVTHSAAFWLSVFYIFTIPWENAIAIPGLGTLTRLVGIFMAMLWLIIVPKTGFRKSHLFHKALLLFMMWSVASAFWSEGIDETIRSIKTYGQLSIMIWVIWDLYRTPTALKAGLQAYILGVYMAVGATLADYFADKPIGDYESRYTGAGLDANEFALILSLAIPVAWHLASSAGARKTERLLRLANFACIPMALFAMLLTASRMALFTAIPGLIFILTRLIQRRSISQILVFTALTGIGMALLTQAPQSSIERLTTTNASIQEYDLGGRYAIWNKGVALFAEHPILGVGTGAFGKAARQTQQVVHNTFLSVLVETGLIGFGLFLITLMVVFYQTLLKPIWGSCLWVTIFLVWTIGASALTLEPTKLTWLFLGLIIIGGSLGNEREKSSSVVAN